MTTVRDVVAILDDVYDPSWAEPWDAVGTVIGQPEAPVHKILLAVDPVLAVADEAVHLQADLLVTHHPLYLSGTSTVAATTPKGRVVHTLLRNDIALHTCHTNADVPALGVSESMAFALGLEDVVPLQPASGQQGQQGQQLDKWVVFVPAADTDAVAEALWTAGAGILGDYERASFRSAGTGTFKPTDGADPAIGSVGQDEHVPETRLEVIAQRSIREHVRAALLSAHPYEEPAYDIFESAAGTAPRANNRGHGRIGRLPESMSLHDFAVFIRSALPAHCAGIRVAGEAHQQVRTVALCGGSGDFLLGQAQSAGADVYVTSDLRHHPVSEHREQSGACAVIDVPHWAAEWTWLPVAAHMLKQRLGDSVELHISSTNTDPWSFTVTADPEPRSPR